MNNKNYRSILDKYSIYIFTIGVGLIVILVIFTSSLIVRRYEDEIVEKREQTLKLTESNFNEYLNATETSVESFALTLSELIQDDDLTEDDIDEYEALILSVFEGYLLSDNHITNSVYVYFSPELTGSAHDVWLTIDDLGEITRQDEIPLQRYISNENMDWFYGPKESRTAEWIVPYTNRFGEYVTSYVAPIYYQDHFIGIVGMYLNLDVASKIIQTPELEKNEVIYILDNNDEVIAHPFVDKGTIIDISETGSLKNYVIITHEIDNGWSFVYQNKEVILESQRIEQIIVIIVSLGITFGLFFLLSRNYQKKYKTRVNHIIESMDRLKKGDYSSRINVMENDELGLMSRSLNGAVDHIETLMNDLEEVAYFHSVTGLPNINKMIQDFYDLINHDPQVRIMICFVKFNKLSTINDLINYDSGNEYLKDIKRRLLLLEDNTRTLYHSHGDTFVFVDNKKESVECTLPKEIKDLFQNRIVVSETEFDLNIFIGNAIYPKHGEEPTEIIRKAEIALNQCTSVSNFVEYEPNIYEKLMKDNVLIVDFRRALESREFVIYFQPVVNVKTDRIDYVEALVRWQHPKKNLIYPNDFIQYAEETGLIIELGDLILEEVCIQIQNWRYMGIEYSVAINVSAKEILEDNFVDKINAMFLKYQINPLLINFEITEHSLLTENDVSVKKLEELRALGCAIVLDDFGTGYSSFNYIQNLPLTTIKIDRLLLEDFNNEKNKLLIESLILMNNKLGLKTIVEGVETIEHLEYIKSLDVTYIQGFYFLRAVTPVDVVKYINSYNEKEEQDED